MSSVPKNKQTLLTAINTSYSKLKAEYDSLPPELVKIPAIKGNIKNTQITVCDTLAYLIGWGQLVLKWVTLKQQGRQVTFPEVGFKWNELGELAKHFYQQYEHLPYDKLIASFEDTTLKITSLIESLDNRQLYETAWYKHYTLGKMIQLNTSSPMKNVYTKIRAFKKGC